MTRIKIEYQDDETAKAVMLSEGNEMALGSISKSATVEILSIKKLPDSGFLPPFVRYLSPSKRVILFERPPTRMNVTFHPVWQKQVSASTAKVTVSIPLPWLVYGITLTNNYQVANVRVFNIDGPISSFDDKIYVLPMLNIYDDNHGMPGQICNAMSASAEITDGLLSQAINEAFQHVWGSYFNYDLTTNISRYHNLAGTLTHALKEVADNPAVFLNKLSTYSILDVCNMKYTQYTYLHTIQHLINSLDNETAEQQTAHPTTLLSNLMFNIQNNSV